MSPIVKGLEQKAKEQRPREQRRCSLESNTKSLNAARDLERVARFSRA